MSSKSEHGFIAVPRKQKSASRTAELEGHVDALEQREWLVVGKYQVRVTYEHENLWPLASLRAMEEENLAGQSIISKAAVAQWRTNMQQRLEFDQIGVHVVSASGSCSCGLSVEIKPMKQKQVVSPEAVREIVLKTAGHFDHRSRTVTDIFIAGRVGPFEEAGFWHRKPGRLVEARWHCIACGDLGEAKRDTAAIASSPALTPFEPRKHLGLHPSNIHSPGVAKKRWQELIDAELEFWNLQQGKRQA